jgi:MGT family glycosyltransferase
LLQRAADALGQLPVRGLVTTGPAVDPAVISAPDNVTVTRWARHADVLPHCSAVITHGGHGTVLKALIAGVPLIVVPLGRDQPDNAGRVVHAGAGVRLRKNATASALRTAVSRVTEDPRYRAAARRMAARLASERDDNLVVNELEQVAAARGPATGHPTPGKADRG